MDEATVAPETWHENLQRRMREEADKLFRLKGEAYLLIEQAETAIALSTETREASWHLRRELVDLHRDSVILLQHKTTNRC